MKSKRYRVPFVPALALMVLPLTCVGQAPPDKSQSFVSQQSFSSPSEATNELIRAAQTYDEKEIYRIFGQDITNLLTGDKVLDQRHFQSFVTNLSAGCEIARDDGHKAELQIGKEKWPFPIPLVENDGTWKFDTAAGVEEIKDRHIGRDEYYAIGVCRAYVKAQQEYAKEFANGGTLKYAEKLKSSPGKTDGLYWPNNANNVASPFSPVVAKAAAEGYGWRRSKETEPFHGYYFRILTRQGPDAPGGKMDYIHHGEMTGGFALVAYPVKWGDSGVMTFIVGQNGVVYQQCLGQHTTGQAAGMKDFDPNGKWTVVTDPGITELTADASSQNGR